MGTIYVQALSCIVIVICIPREHLRVHNNSLKRVRAFKIELEFGNVVFFRGEENRSAQRKTSRSRGENQQQTQHT